MSLPGKDQFEKFAGDSFQISFHDDQEIPCQIKEIKSVMPPNGDDHNEQFSVVFTSADENVFQQGVYAVKHQHLGSFDLFLVPIFGDEKGVQYEAVFT